MRKVHFAFLISVILLASLIFFLPEFFMPALKEAPAAKWTKHYILASILMSTFALLPIFIVSDLNRKTILYVLACTFIAPAPYLFLGFNEEIESFSKYAVIYLWMAILYFIPAVIISSFTTSIVRGVWYKVKHKNEIT